MEILRLYWGTQAPRGIWGAHGAPLEVGCSEGVWGFQGVHGKTWEG